MAICAQLGKNERFLGEQERDRIINIISKLGNFYFSQLGKLIYTLNEKLGCMNYDIYLDIGILLWCFISD